MPQLKLQLSYGMDLKSHPASRDNGCMFLSVCQSQLYHVSTRRPRQYSILDIMKTVTSDNPQTLLEIYPSGSIAKTSY